MISSQKISFQITPKQDIYKKVGYFRNFYLMTSLKYSYPTPKYAKISHFELLLVNCQTPIIKTMEEMLVI